MSNVKTRGYYDMYWLDIGLQKMQKTEVSDGTFPNSDTPVWIQRKFIMNNNDISWYVMSVDFVNVWKKKKGRGREKGHENERKMKEKRQEKEREIKVKKRKQKEKDR